MFNNEHGVASACRSIADLFQVVTTSTSPVIAASGHSALVVKEPYGVVLGIFSPEHSPRPGATGLPAAAGYGQCRGNTVVLKGPKAAPGTMWGVASPLLFTMPAFRLAASTPCTMIPRMLVSSPRLGKYLKPTAMEFRGKAPAIVCEDVDLAKAARGCGMWVVSMAPFVNSGQIYMSTKRIIFNFKVAEEFYKVLLFALKDSSDTQGWDVAQLVSDVAVINNKKLITDALSKGAQLLADDMGHGIESASKLRLTIITGVRKDMDIYYKGSFGPVVSLLVVIPPSKEMI
ncbi:Aldedh domain-containing protein [Trichoderma simmonsii]|uniref:Aldedh domain-containing protein n=1 Tax=Trichoderma simmonsii TaxID=1491479 RepID=A0A8G0LQD2_9HYPO|nr:Aldedh domain-containing protein [Trichoderma simmonsii]